MPTEPSIFRADLRQAWQRVKLWHPLAGVLAIAAIRYSQHQLDLGGHSPTARALWALLPLPPLIAAAWSIVRTERSKSELERQIAYAAGIKALLVTGLGLIILGQVDSTLALGGSAWRYRDLWVMPLLAYFVLSVLETKRYTQG